VLSWRALSLVLSGSTWKCLLWGVSAAGALNQRAPHSPMSGIVQVLLWIYDEAVSFQYSVGFFPMTWIPDCVLGGHCFKAASYL